MVAGTGSMDVAVVDDCVVGGLAGVGYAMY